MSESVSGVDAILAGLEERARREPHRGCVSLLDAEAAVHATVQEIVTMLRTLAQEVRGTGADCVAVAADEVARRFGSMWEPWNVGAARDTNEPKEKP